MNKDKTKASPSPQESVMVTMEPGKIVDARTLKASDHVKALDPVLLVITALTACLGAIIGLELITRVGVTQNTSITGALLAVVPLRHHRESQDGQAFR